METNENVATMLPIVPINGKINKNSSIDQGTNDDIISLINSLNDSISKNDNIAFEKYIEELSYYPEYNDIMTESVLKDESDIFYNKMKFENGDTNLLFIVGYSGGGKSTISNNEKKALREVVDMDRIVLGMAKPDSYFEELGLFADSFVKGPGKQFRVEGNQMKENLQKSDFISYRPKISRELFKYAVQYSQAHKSMKLIMEGVWIYRYIEPADAKPYAVYIKGTSLKTSLDRAAKRDIENGNAGKNTLSRVAYHVGKLYTASKDAISGALTKWQNFYRDRYEAQLEVGNSQLEKVSTNKIKGIIHDVKNGKVSEDMKIIKNSIKDSYKNAKSGVKNIHKKVLKESVLNFILDINSTNIDEFVSESVKDEIINFSLKANISRKLRVLSADIAIMKFKLKCIDDDSLKAKDLKREIIAKEQEKRKLMDELTNEEKNELKKLEKEAEKLVEKEFKELEDEMKDEIPDEDEKEIKESAEVNVIEKSDDTDNEEPQYLSPEAKRIDEILGDIAKYENELKIAREKFEVTGESIYEKKIKGLTSKLETLHSKKEELEKEIKKVEAKEVTEAASMEEEIKPIVDKLNSLGYKVKYASPGHKNLRKKEDQEPDGVYYGRLYSDARIMFDDKYDFKETPQYWFFRDVDGCSYLDIAPFKYNEEDGTPAEAFDKWKTNYMNSLKNFVDSLRENKDVKESADYDDITVESILNNAFEKFM